MNRDRGRDGRDTRDSTTKEVYRNNSRDLSSDRERNSNRDTDRYSDRDRDRYYDRDRYSDRERYSERNSNRDTDRYSDRDKERNSDRDRNSARDKEREIEKKSSRQDKEQSSRKKSRHTNEKEEGEEEEPEFYFTASQIVGRVCEVFASTGKMRLDNLKECFNPNFKIEIIEDQKENNVLEGPVAIEMITASIPHKSEPLKQIAIESSIKSHPTFAVDFYADNNSPGLGKEGSCIVLYVALNNQLIHAYIIQDHENLISSASLPSKTIKQSKMWLLVHELVKNNIPKKDNWEWNFVYNNYQKMSDGLGIGLGESSSFELWTEKL